MVVQQYLANYHRHRCGCCDVGSADDCDDVCEHQVPVGHAANCKFGLVSTCRRPMNAEKTSASCGLNYETKDLLKLDSCVIRWSAKLSSHRTNDASEREKSSQEHEKGNRQMSAVDSQHHRHDRNAKHSIVVACSSLIEMFPGEIGLRDSYQPQRG